MLPIDQKNSLQYKEKSLDCEKKSPPKETDPEVKKIMREVELRYLKDPEYHENLDSRRWVWNH